MKWLDKLTADSSRTLAQRTSRRSLLTKLGTLAVGTASIPLLPVARAAGGGDNMYPGVGAQSTGTTADPGDPASCDYWRYCAIDGFLCSCCGGTKNSCPPGTEMSPITWIGTCRNPGDGRNYVISYNDCCGRSSCGACLCQRDEGDRPPYRSDKTNDVNWCLGTSSSAYHCSTAVVVGVALEKDA